MLARVARRVVVAPLLVIVVLVTASCSSASDVPKTSSSGVLAPTSAECVANHAAGVVKFASPFGYDASAGILDVYAAIQLGYFKDLCLSVDFVDVPSSASPYSLVSADTAQISGEGSAADTLVEAADGANLIGIATYGDTSDYALLTKPKVTKLTQLEGGILAYHTVLPVVLTEMLAKAGVNLAKVHTVDDFTYNPLLLTEGKFDALQAYQSNEPFTLRAAGASFRMWTPAQFDIPGTFNVVVANRRFVATHRQAAADFLRAEFHAFSYCQSHVATCVGFLAKAQGPTFLLLHGEQEWRYESALAVDHHLAGEGIGVESTAEWTPEAKAVVQYKRVSHPVDLATAEDTRLAASLYRGTTLIWP